MSGNRLALNKFNCGQRNFHKRAWDIKCSCLPKDHRKENKALLKVVWELQKTST